ncbi:HlyD family secretion protein [Vibrio tapetis]|uniref:Membrane fusion protein (MFP) component of efflux pump, signal anchor n=1 Tax=Vibrio tapetis subsp. tapetis TaxID=1671868 RepID=A0A2N8ZL71_9VIBR|nr:HlyD family secretion protein [Vibrio tapetis]SON52642.1 membrane fusion protein (MFP) component of efflux pump, signal anchor [Vibrio tapetis subsp. tapetis]
MDLLLILTYAALCIAVFKIFKIPLNKWTVPTAVLGGVVLIGTLILLMNYNHPFTQLGGQYYTTTPIVPSVKGKVIEVNAQPNTPMKEGDILFKIDPTPFKAELIRKKAALVAAEQGALQLESQFKEAQAGSIKAEADRDKAKREFARYEKGFAKGAFTEQQVDTRRQAYKAAQAGLEAAIANTKQAELAFTSEIDGENTTVAQRKAELEQAQFNFDETTVRAPTDGYVTQLALRPGMMAVPIPLRPVMTFVHTEDKFYVGAFRQNSLQRLQPGFQAEFLFRALPGRVFTGEIVEVIPAIGEGQIQASGSLLTTNALRSNGRTMVKLRITDDLSKYHLPMGSNAEIAIYSDSFTHVSIMRKVLIRMKSWQNYLYLDH